KVRNHIYWCPEISRDLERDYVYDVALRPNEEGLSIFRSNDRAEADKVAHYFALTIGGDNHVDYMLIPNETWSSIGLYPQLISLAPPHHFLAARHYEVRGLTKNQESELVDIILQNPTDGPSA